MSPAVLVPVIGKETVRDLLNTTNDATDNDANDITTTTVKLVVLMALCLRARHLSRRMPTALRGGWDRRS